MSTPRARIGRTDMESLDNILICIRQADQASWLLGYTSAICRTAKPRRVHLLHVDPPASPGHPTPPASASLTTGQLRTLAADHLKYGHPENVICHCASGAPLIEILRYALDEDVNLIILGRGADEDSQTAALARRVTTKATCSVLVVPQNATFRAERILVPVRHSDCSARAVEAACLVAACAGGTVSCLNVFPLRSDYLEADLTLQEHTALMRQWAERENQQLLAGVSTGTVRIVTQCEPDIFGRPAKIILQAIAGESPDMVVIGARGRTGAAGVLLGAVTEQLICRSPVPVLAVKKKGECIGVLRALLTLAG